MSLDIDKHIERMKLVKEETEKDVHDLEGKPFNGKVVAEYHGYMSAGIEAIADTLQEVLKHLKDKETLDNLKEKK